MRAYKGDWGVRLRLCLTGVLCVCVLFFGIGTAQGRYRMAVPQEIQFQAAEGQQILLWNGDTEEPTQLQTLTDWTATGVGSAALAFRVSNGTADGFSAQALRFSVRIAASQGFGDPGNIQLTLKLNEKEYTAKAVPILAGSARYETFGPGWIYCFYNSGGDELTWELLGGKLSAVDAVLTVEGSAEEISLLRVEVTAFQET